MPSEKRNCPLYAIIRLDLGCQGPIADRIMVTKIVTDVDSAEAETARLNQLNGKDSLYFWRTTRIRSRLLAEILGTQIRGD